LKRVRAALSRDAAREPLGWQARYRWVHGFHYMQVGIRSLAVLAHDHEVLAVHPFAQSEFLGALAALPRPRRFHTRGEAMRELFDDLLPRELHSRSTKAQFDGAFWAEYSRQLVARWQGEGVDPDLVDVEILKDVWTSPSPDARSFTLLQAVWLAQEPRKQGSTGNPVEQELDSVV
jgi:asparagine synthase (glutamine-hydrolysing)